MKIKLLLLMLSLLLFSNCTFGIPLLTTTAGQLRSSDEKLVEFADFQPGDKVQITTNNYSHFVGEVLYFEELSPGSLMITKALHQRILTELNLQVDDTLRIIANGQTYNGIFKGLDNRRIILINYFGEQQLIPWRQVDHISINQIDIPKEIISAIKPSKFEKNYKIKIRTKDKDILFYSKDIFSIEALVTPYNRNTLMLSAVIGFMLDIFIIIVNLGPIPMT